MGAIKSYSCTDENKLVKGGSGDAAAAMGSNRGILEKARGVRFGAQMEDWLPLK